MIRRLLIGLLVVPCFAQGQVTSGTVRDSVNHVPIAGAVLTLFDSANAVLGRMLTNEQGDYSFQLAGARKMRVQKIGFRPVNLSLPSGAGRVDVTLLAIPALLDSVKVAVNSRCSRRKDAAAASALLEQARSGLLATIVARDANQGTIVRLVFDRRIDPFSDQPLRMRVRRDSTEQASMAFKAVHDGAYYVANGFADLKNGQQVFYSPDAEVLLDDGFAAGYCFRLVDPPRSRRGQIGLGFAESERKKDRVGIDGVLWVDTVARALSDIEFKYTGFTNLDRFRPGGSTTFHEMKNGIVLITGWMIRLPKRLPDTTISRGRQRISYNVYAVEDGGKVVSAHWPDGTHWTADLGRARLRAVTPQADAPAAGYYLRLAGTDYWGQTDSNGMVAFDDLEPGPYDVTLVDTALVALGLKPDTIARFVALRDSLVTQTIGVRGTADFVVDRCLASHRGAARDGLLLGRVISTHGDPVNKADVSLRFPGTSDDVYKMTTSDDGIFSACFGSGRRGETYTIIARTPDGATDAQTKTFKDTVTFAKLVLDLPTTTSTAYNGPLVRVQGIAWDSLHAMPLAGAFIGLSGTSRSVMSDSTGHFTFDSVPPGQYQLTLQHDVVDAAGMSSIATRVTASAKATDTAHISLPSFATFWKSLCQGPTPAQGWIVYGAVLDTGGKGVKQPLRLGTEIRDKDSTTFADRLTDSTGTYVSCGSSPTATIRVVLADPTASAPADLPPTGGTRVIRHDFVLKRPEPHDP
jgi:hypothetical protein